MNINRNNYEEFFLLYADNELSAGEKNSVEVFVRLNPDLEEEFIMLQQSVVKPDNIKLDDKSFLMKEERFITKNNYEEKFILYNDNELDESEREEMKKFLQTDPPFQNEFEFFLQTKYQPDNSIVFPNKNSLYKNEKPAKIIPLNWLRATAAAFLLGIGLWAGINFLQKNAANKDIILAKPAKKNNEIKLPSESKQPFKNVIVTTDNTPVKPSVKMAKNNFISQQQILSQQNITAKNIDQNNKIKEENTVSKSSKDFAINEQPKPNEPITNIKNIDVKSNNLPEPVDKNLTPAVQNKYAQTASYINEPDEKSDNYVFYNVTDDQFKKSKLGIFLKKVKRVIERKNPLKENSSGE